MAGEVEKHDRTEPATPRKREEARERGRVALSSELLSATTLCAALGALVLAGGVVCGALGSLVARALDGLRGGSSLELSAQSAAGLLAEAARSVSGSLSMVLLPLLVLVALVAYAQVGLRVTPRALSFDPERLNPVKNVSKLASMRGVVRTSTALLKISAILVTTVTVAWLELPRVAELGGELGPSLAGARAVILRCALAAVIAIAVLAVADWAYQRWQHERDLRMSKKEVRDELKNTEGDPQIKARVRQLQREVARRRMMADVPKATVVVTNPTHFAVALCYDRELDGTAGRAPRVVAKGVDQVARRIKEVALEAGVPLHEDRLLARALHSQVEIGDEIPEDLFQAVAAVLSTVWKLEGAGAVR